jgi:23S rRNA U2552 (ribose-2'-O)-methylase RlmE/FtsJ
MVMLTACNTCCLHAVPNCGFVEAVLLLPACAGVQPVLPPRFCDDRVQVLQADARLLTPAVLERYTTDVSAEHQHSQLVGYALLLGYVSSCNKTAAALKLAAGVSTHAASTAGSAIDAAEISARVLCMCCGVLLQGFDVVLSDMLQFTSGVNDVELSLELANTAMNVATGHYYDEYGEAYAQQMGFRHTGFLRPGGNLVMKVYEVRAMCACRGQPLLLQHMLCNPGVRTVAHAACSGNPLVLGPFCCPSGEQCAGMVLLLSYIRSSSHCCCCCTGGGNTGVHQADAALFQEGGKDAS